MKYVATPFTIVLLVGPTRCGKSTFAQKLAAQYPGDARILSSDGLRKFHQTGVYKEADDIYEDNNTELMEMSRAAFSTLEHLLTTWTTFPVNAEFIIVDSTGLQEDFRNQIFEIGVKNHYNVDLVYFDYSLRDYRVAADTDLKKFVIDKHIKVMKQDVLPRLSKSRYHQAIKVSSRNTNNWEDLTVEMAAHVDDYTFEHEGPVSVIGDVHENVDALRDLEAKLPENTMRVYVGDLFDKGQKTKEMVEYVHGLMTEAEGPARVFVKGNHENYLAKRIRGQLEEHATPEIEETYFTALKVLMEDEAVAAKFLEIHDAMVPFAKIKSHGERNTIYVTHAPCQQKYIGKMTPAAFNAMRNFRIEKGMDEKEALKHVFEEAANNMPIHCFGHVAHCSTNVFFRNKAFLDRGAVHTGELTAAIYDGFRRSVEVGRGLAAMPEGVSTLPDLLHFEKKVLTRNDFDLDEYEERQLRMYKRNGIRYISGTMAPAPSDSTSIESLEAGLDMFLKRGCEKVVIQPKFMGSRCQVYLTRGDLGKCFAVSRNGYRISDGIPGVREAIAKILHDHEQFHDWKETLILDGELLPWSTLGEGLIEYQFHQYAKSVQSELVELANDPLFQNFDIGKEFNTTKRLELLEVFNTQLELYGKKEEVRYQPFAVLSVDGKASELDNHSSFQDSGEQQDFRSMIFDLTKDYTYESIKSLFKLYTTEDHMEGIVIKPLEMTPGMIPYMKVRNEDYLTLVYGYDYKMRYDQLRERKNVSGKLKMSIKEHALATEMLTASPERLEGMYCEMMFNIRQEKELDPRL